MLVTIEKINRHNGIKEYRYIYGRYEEEEAKKHIQEVIWEYEYNINVIKGLELDDQDKINDILAASNLEAGEYNFYCDDYLYIITINDIEMIEVKNDWSWVVLHAKNLMTEDKELNEDVLKIAKKNRIDIISIIDLYSEGLDNGMDEGKYLSFKDWFYSFYSEEL